MNATGIKIELFAVIIWQNHCKMLFDINLNQFILPSQSRLFNNFIAGHVSDKLDGFAKAGWSLSRASQELKRRHGAYHLSFYGRWIISDYND